MIAGEKLAAWLGDREAQGLVRTAVESILREWNGPRILGDIHPELAALTDPTREQVIDIARRIFGRAAVLDELLQALIAQSRANPFFLPPLHPLTSEVHSGLLLFHHPELSIGLGVTPLDLLATKKVFRSGGASIAFTGVTNLFRYVKSGNALVSFWEVPRISAGFRAEDAGQCKLVGRRRISDGEEFLIDGSRQSFVVEHAEGDIVYLQATIQTGAAPLAVEYDSESLDFINASSTDEASSRVQMMATLLREMDREDAVPVLRQLLDSQHFYTRWHVMREMLALDAEACLPDLRRLAAHDPHPEVRTAARRTLELFFDLDEPAPQEAPAACHA
jgi:hypothetical protein